MTQFIKNNNSKIVITAECKYKYLDAHKVIDWIVMGTIYNLRN